MRRIFISHLWQILQCDFKVCLTLKEKALHIQNACRLKRKWPGRCTCSFFPVNNYNCHGLLHNSNITVNAKHYTLIKWSGPKTRSNLNKNLLASLQILTSGHEELSVEGEQEMAFQSKQVRSEAWECLLW